MIKCFPSVLRNFPFEEGVQHALLDFYSDGNETSEVITNQFCKLVEMEECSLLQHVVMRWLSLLRLGEEECPMILWKCFGKDGTEVSQICFLFLSHILKAFSDCIEALEAKSFSITSV